MTGYRTVEKPAAAEIIIKKSRFIGQVSPVADEQEANAFVAGIKKKHRDATHNCHAWIISPLNQRSNDDGEPSGTAGRPMLEVLRNESLERVAVVVTRYFGGVKLGANGLVRAYAHACKAALVAGVMGRQQPHQQVLATVDYTLYGKLENQLQQRGLDVLDSQFGHHVAVTLGVPKQQVDDLEAWLVDLTNGQVDLERGKEYYHFVRGK